MTPEKPAAESHVVPSERSAAFCAALADACNVGRAARAIGVSRWTVYRWRQEDSAFAAAWDDALKAGLLALEDEAHRRAFEGTDKPLQHQGQFTHLRDFDAINPETGERYVPDAAPVMRDAEGRPVLATVKEYSDTLAIFLLKAHAPDKYRENARVEIDASVALAEAIVAARGRVGA